MPGVVISTVATGQAGVPDIDSGQIFIVGSTQRGPEKEVKVVRGLADFESVFGGRLASSYTYDLIDTYFRSGGTQAQVVRLNGAGERATITASSRGEGIGEYEFTAPSAGAWGNEVSLVVKGTDTAPATVEVYVGTTRVHNISAPTAQYLAMKLAKSPYVRVESYDPTAEGTDSLPAEGTYTLAGGTTTDNTPLQECLDLFTPGLGDGALLYGDPGVASEVNTLVTHAEENRRVVLLHFEPDSADPNQIETDIDALGTSQYAAVFTPHITILSDGVNRTVPPTGAVAGVRAFAHNNYGAHRIPAGQAGTLDYVVSSEQDYTANEVNAIDALRGSAIRKVNGTYRVYGYRSLSRDEVNWKYLTAQDLINRIATQLEGQLEQFVFAPIDGKGQLQSSIEGVAMGILADHADAGALYPKFNDAGEQLDPGFTVDAGSSVNTTETLANNTIRLNVQLRTSPASALIEVTIIKLALDQ